MSRVKFTAYAIKKDSTRSVRIFFLKLGVAIDLCKLLKINSKNSRQYHPQSQGNVEHLHGTGKRKLVFDMKREYSKTMII